MKIIKSVTIEGFTYALGALNLDQYEAHFLGEDGEPLKRPRTGAAIRDSLANANDANNPAFEDIPAGVAAKLIYEVMRISGFMVSEGEAKAEATA